MDCKFLYVMGAESGAGKSTVCLGVLAQLLAGGVHPNRLAYIKPMTQCLETQTVAEFCSQTNITCRAIDGLVFSKGFTRDFIAGLTKSSDELLAEISAGITAIGRDKTVVVVDGIGGPAVGSVIGVSNVDIALALCCNVIFVGKPGVGAAIDNTVLCVSFMQGKGIKNIAIIYNNLPFAEINSIQPSVAKRIAELLPNTRLLGFVVHNGLLESWVKNKNTTSIAQWFMQYLDGDVLFQDLGAIRPTRF